MLWEESAFTFFYASLRILSPNMMSTIKAIVKMIMGLNFYKSTGNNWTCQVFYDTSKQIYQYFNIF